MTTYLIRADASPRIGAGHVMRCLALAQAIQDQGGVAVFATAMEAPAIEARLRAENCGVERIQAEPGSRDDALQTFDSAAKAGANWIIADGYHFGAQYQRDILQSGLHLLFFDDCGHAEHYSAHYVLNQNIYAHADLYTNREPYTQLLLGARYTLLRREFLSWSGRRGSAPEIARKILVTLGGSDPDNITRKVIHAVASPAFASMEIRVLAGASNPHIESLRAACRLAGERIRLESHAANMPELLAWADLAVTAAANNGHH